MSQVSQCYLPLPGLVEQKIRHNRRVALLSPRASPEESSSWLAGLTGPLNLFFQVTGDQAVYENEVVAARDVKSWSHGSITRDSIFR